VAALESLNADVVRVPPGAVGNARRAALASASEHAPECGVLACDFDRWLHWARFHPDELARLPQRIAAIRPEPWFVCVGRTERAFATHPRAQRDPEAATNHALELAVGFPVDAVSGACWLTPKAVSLVLAHSCEMTAATDLEWPAIVFRHDRTRLSAISVEGLEFETPTFFPEEVAQAGGRERWIVQTYERPDVWADRLMLAALSVSALARTLSGPG
jgi:hypothetical protein